ncbi:phage holin family protein [Virgibacillus pantothenticus]|uniref:phage holin family protein n=1 Tax=Virgibacillus pantothenticus TaxID=1473 RepID=UPI001C2159B2|nr:phage holin family protein [Virgibacillus pantothenticus]MBU8566293.1 phage holin family protein [Virgibacillus pantothenticus]MBU8600716.1 phage holin family protein [Virgibacillus pantothenticus]MBU8634576.1 phage holin family protein [Virgibacillus pantothenticus]MBU8640823.1 phage holin family protein [Virgibacillus pantothenticus]MBU8646422.1 phage holin family protein [Virgibacillus pantothenticus]
MRWLLSIVLNAVALIVVAQLFDSFHLEGFGTAVLASIILSILNILVKPILVILTLPVTMLTLGLFLFIINAITLMMTQAVMGSSFVIDGFGTAVLAAIIISIINVLLNRLVQDSFK